ncbi:MAG: SUMF1/EgtB/PvdO family nonheme iron enzyme [Pyrinomonadaceae bacterium]
MSDNLRETIAKRFMETRAKTLEIFELTDEAALRQSPGFGFRPILWHLAHQGTFEEYWLLQKIGGANAVNESFQRIFDPIKTPRENSTDLPSKAEMLEYLQAVRENVLKALDRFDFTSDDSLQRDGYVFNLVHQHELQHQETLAYLFHLLPPDKKVQSSKFKVQSSKPLDSFLNSRHSSFEIAAGNFIVGAASNDFAYDNEIPAHELFIPAFKLDKFLVTNAEFAEFIAEKGYEREEFWSPEGWQLREKENLNAPLYWQKSADNWRIRTMFAEKSLTDLSNFPVYGVSFFEAEAYALFRGKRLPTEFEWEKAASLNALESEDCNFGWRFGETTPVNYFENKSFADIRGNLWEWTSSNFAPYPNFNPFPYEDYSAAWFDGDHKVLKGGSFVTSKEMLRSSFRNFFRRQFRIAFAGIRLAASV